MKTSHCDSSSIANSQPTSHSPRNFVVPCQESRPAYVTDTLPFFNWRADAGVELAVAVPAVLESVFIIAERHCGEFFVIVICVA